MFEDFKEVICLGMGGTYSEIAKDKLFKAYNLFLYQRSLNGIKECIDYVDENPQAIAVLPVETTYKGIIRETIDNLIATKNSNVKILAETIIPVNDCILSKTTEFYSITGIIANQQALGQCNDFIKNEMPRNLNIIEATNPSEAARSLQNYNLTYASIGSKKLAEVYNLNVLKESINDDKTNRTNYVLIGNVETEPTGHDKTTLMFTTEDRPGALMEILNIFYYNNVNLSYISSQISKDNDNKYIFVVSFDGHVKDNNISSTISQVEDKAAYFKIIGSYEK